MNATELTRTLLGPADPARHATVPAPVPAAALIALAEATPAQAHRVRATRPLTRRLVLAGGGAAVLAGGAAVLTRYGRSGEAPPSGPERGAVLVPMEYQVASNPPPAGPELRALAARIGAAPYESQAGRYEYHRDRTWGGMWQSDTAGHRMSYVFEDQTWTMADGTGYQHSVQLEPEFPDEASRRYWQKAMARWTPDPRQTTPGPWNEAPVPLRTGQLPTDRAALATLMGADRPVDGVPKLVAALYSRYLPSRAARAQILLILAGLPGFVWRGEVTDRAGRTGVAITLDDPEHGDQQALVFDPATAVLFAEELVRTSPRQVEEYQLFLAYGRTDRVG